MAQQLFISGVAVDMPADEIKIKVDSNLFSDADKIKTAHSYNIVLPRSATNDAMFSLAFLPSSETGGTATHTYLTASLFVDDVPLFELGQAVLTSVDEKGYNVNLFWGLIGAFDEIKREGLKLNELALSSHWNENLEVWQLLTRNSGTLAYVSGMDTEKYNALPSGDNKNEVALMPWSLPVVTANSILQNIVAVYGLNLDIAPDAQLRIDKLYHPLTSLNSKCKDERLNMSVKGGGTLVNGHYRLTFATIQLNSDGDIVFGNSFGYNWYASNSFIANNALFAINDNAGRLVAKNDLTFKKISVTGDCDWGFHAILNENGDSESVAYSSVYNNRYRINKTWENVKISRGDYIITLGSDAQGVSVPINDIVVELELDGIDGMRVAHSTLSGQKNNYYPYTRNYPDIDIIKYINEILAHIGGFIEGSVTEQDAIHIRTLDSVFSNTPNNVEVQGVTKIEMSLESLAQKNIYKHKENVDNGIDYTAEGIIYTNDSTLALERTAFESHFKVPYNALIRLWQIDGDTAKWVGKGNYICGVDNTTNPSSARNTGQDFATIISDYYVNFENVTKRPKSVEAVVRLSVLDLQSLDITSPMYIEQLGRAYLIENFESDSEQKYKFKLVQI